MLKHAGMLEAQPSMIPTFNNTSSPELQWRAWLHREAQNRYVPLIMTPPPPASLSRH